MTDETTSPVVSGAMELPADAPDTFDSVAEASAYYDQLQEKRAKPAESAEAEKPATAEPELSKGDRNSDPDNGDPETDPAEVTEEAEPEALPPIEPPRSWTQAEKERFQSLPRETQEYLHTREQERERDFRRGQNEIAEQRKAFEAERLQAEKVRQEYEAKLPELVKQIHQQGPFADIKSQDDADALAQNDPFRYLQWDAYQKRLAGMAHEAREVEARQSQERQSQWAQHVQKENELAIEYIPDLADKVKGPALTNRVATELLPELGFKGSELAELASGKSKLSIYDHRVQRLLADALKLRDIQAAPKAVSAKPLPPVQKPGTSKPAGSVSSEREQALTRKPELSVAEATELYGLQQSRARRAS